MYQDCLPATARQEWCTGFVGAQGGICHAVLLTQLRSAESFFSLKLGVGCINSQSRLCTSPHRTKTHEEAGAGK
eukprot:6021794-Amphidinium_carterae.1